MAESDDGFWKVLDPAFWAAYVSTRPVFSDAFYDEIFNYHEQHSSEWALAHDVASGSGSAIAKLAKRFQHVVASDNQADHLAVAKSNVANLDAGSVSFVVSKGEDLHHNDAAPGDADLVFCSEALPAMDEAAAMHSFHTLLRPGGTLAVDFYGRPIFAEPTFSSRCQPTLDAITDWYFDRMFRPGGAPVPDPQVGFLRHTAAVMASWFDCVDFPPDRWTDVRRVKWNPRARLEFFGETVVGAALEWQSNVRPADTVVEIEDPDWWSKTWTADDLRMYFRVLFPGFEQITDADDGRLKRLFETLEEEMGGKGVSRKFTWAAVLVLATKK